MAKLSEAGVEHLQTSPLWAGSEPWFEWRFKGQVGPESVRNEINKKARCDDLTKNEQVWVDACSLVLENEFS